jgi:sterol desaturase/sphingolipid hydroxylase (fatty acid hydroxylase superfamily)
MEFLQNFNFWIISSILFCVLIEYFFPSGQKTKYLRAEIFQDFFLWIVFADVWLHPILENIISSVAYKWFSYLPINNFPFSIQGFGLFKQVLILYFVFEVLDYFLHRFLHVNKWGWKIHQCHHSSKFLDWYSEARNHPLHVLIRLILIWIPIAFFLRPDLKTIFIFNVFLRCLGLLLHADVNWRWWPPFSWIFASPFIHRWHHSKELGGHCNYANTLILLDYIFFTHKSPPVVCTNFGFNGDEIYPKDFIQRFCYPLDIIVRKFMKNFN